MSPSFVQDMQQTTYDGILSYVPFAQFGFKAKSIAGPISHWKGIPDPELPFSQAPVAIASPSYQEVNKGEPATVTGSPSYVTASNPNTTITSYEWDFGDGSTSFGRDVEHSYSEIGDYDGTLTITDSNGLSDVASFHVRVVNVNAFRTIYAISEAMELAVTFNDGLDWRVYNLRSWKQLLGLKGTCVAVHPKNRLIAWFGDNTGRVWTTVNGLLSVEDPILTMSSGIIDIAVDPYTGNTLLIACEDNCIYKVPLNTYSNRLAIYKLLELPDRPVEVAISNNNANYWAVAAGSKFYVSKNYGGAWDEYENLEQANARSIEFSKVLANVVGVSTTAGAFIFDTGYNRTTFDMSTPVRLMSFLPNSLNGVIIAFEESPVINGNIATFWKSDPFANINPNAVFPPAGDGVDILKADNTTKNKFWYTYSYELFRLYAISSDIYETGSVLQLNSRFMDVSQGPLISTYDRKDFGDLFPIDYPPPPTYGPDGGVNPYPGYNPYDPCYFTPGIYSCWPPNYFPDGGTYDPTYPDLPPIYFPPLPGWPQIDPIPIGDDFPLDPYIPFGNDFTVCSLNPEVDLVYVEEGGPSGQGYFSLTDGFFETKWIQPITSGQISLEVNFWAKLSTWTGKFPFVGWKIPGCPGQFICGFDNNGVVLTGEMAGKVQIFPTRTPHYWLPNSGIMGSSFAASVFKFPPMAGFDVGQGGKYWPVLRQGSDIMQTEHVFDLAADNYAFIDPNKWYHFSAWMGGNTAYLRITTPGGSSVEINYNFHDRDLYWHPSSFFADLDQPGAYVQSLVKRPGVAFIGKPRMNIYTDESVEGSQVFEAFHISEDHSTTALPPYSTSSGALIFADPSIGKTSFEGYNFSPSYSGDESEAGVFLRAVQV